MLDKKGDVRRLLESHDNPDLDQTKLDELVSSNAQLKDVYDSRPELQQILKARAKLYEEEVEAHPNHERDSPSPSPSP